MKKDGIQVKWNQVEFSTKEALLFDYLDLVGLVENNSNLALNKENFSLVYLVNKNTHGIIVYRASQNEFYAFDRTCTFEEQLDEAVDLDIPTDLTAKCPNCGSIYILPNLAYPDKDGPAVYPLKQYFAEYSNNTVWVHN